MIRTFFILFLFFLFLLFPVTGWSQEAPAEGSSPAWVSLDGEFPRQAIEKAGCTFIPRQGVFSFRGGLFAWEEGLGIHSLRDRGKSTPDEISMEREAIGFSWNGPDNQNSSEGRFCPTFPRKGIEKLRLETFLEYGGRKILFMPFWFPVQVIPMNDLVEAAVHPKDFRMTIGDTMAFDFLIKSRENPGNQIKNQGAMMILDGRFSLKLMKVIWFVNGKKIHSALNGESFFYTTIDVGNLKNSAQAKTQLEEVRENCP